MRKFNTTNQWIEKLADFIKSELWDIEKYTIKNSSDISCIFLAGAPGAGKTEFLESILQELQENFVVIDIDKYRSLFKWYNWENASKYQSLSVKVADKIISYCFKNNLNFIFDGTFRNYNKVQENFWQCKKHDRKAIVALIFQDPRVSFYWTFLRKLKKRRNVPIDVFINGFYGSIENVFRAKQDFSKIEILIASKKYSLVNKHKFTRSIDYKISNIKDFCKKYRIWYDNWVFTNRGLLELDIKMFNDTLIAHFWWKWWLINKLRLLFIKIFYRL